MAKITALRTGRGKRVNIFLDGRFAFSLAADLAVKEGLQIGQELSQSGSEELVKADGFHRCLKAATYYLSYRPRSESELRERLGRHSFVNDTQRAVITKLKEQGLVDDLAFAQYWSYNRESFSPRSRWLTELELRRKGVANEIIAEVVKDINDDDSAYQAALNKSRSLYRSEYEDFRRRLGGYLRRRGFSYGVTNHTVERLWQEQGR
ncbi:RecX family transcriptional regulator [Chloroflexota bacterium]